jgi:hypothetical protein
MIRATAVFLTIFIFFTSIALAQEILFEKEIRLKRGLSYDRREAYPVKSNVNQQLSLFLIDKKQIKGLLFDKDLKLIDSLEGDRPDSRYPQLLGSNMSDKQFSLFFESKSHSSLASVSFDYETKKVTQTIIELPFNKEKYAGSASYDNKFYVLTVKKNSSVLNIYVFENRYNYAVHTIDFKKEQFREPPYYTMYDVMRENQFETIDNEIPNSIEVASKKDKLYCYDNKMVITFDNVNADTKVISIDLSAFSADLKVYNKTSPENCNSTDIKTNSYLYKNNIYQFFVCSSGMDFSITNMKKKELLNSFQVLKDEELYFKNTPIFQEGGIYSDDHELSKTKQFLRKSATANIGVCAYQSSNGIEVTLGSCKEIQMGTPGPGMMTPGGSFSTPGGVVNTPATYYPTYSGYSSYKFTKSVYFKSLLNSSTFEQINTALPDNAFDQIKKFTKTKEDYITAETIIKKENFLILGYYEKDDHNYIMRAFRDQ